MRNHKTGCGRCHPKKCCCQTGPPGPPGSTGPAGPTGPSGGGLALFANVLGAAPLGYMNNSGGGALSATPRNYPIGQTTLLSTLAVHLDGVLVPGLNESVTVTVLRNGLPTGLTVTFTDANLTVVSRTLIVDSGETFEPGDLLDVAVENPDGILALANISASIS